MEHAEHALKAHLPHALQRCRHLGGVMSVIVVHRCTVQSPLVFHASARTAKGVQSASDILRANAAQMCTRGGCQCVIYVMLARNGQNKAFAKEMKSYALGNRKKSVGTVFAVPVAAAKYMTPNKAYGTFSIVVL